MHGSHLEVGSGKCGSHCVGVYGPEVFCIWVKKGRSPKPSLTNTCGYKMDQRAFVMTLPQRPPPEIWAWGQHRFHRMRQVSSGDKFLVGAMFKKAPRSLKRFQSLVNNNFKNWGYDKDNHYDRGWLRFCSVEEFRLIFLRKEIQENWQRLAAKKLDSKVQAAVLKLNERRKTIKAGLKRMEQRRAKRAFDALAAVIYEKQARRAAKRAQFNVERYGFHTVPHASYTNKELDECNCWREVAQRRGPQTGPDELRLEKICQEQAQSGKFQEMYGGKPVGF